MRNGRTTDKIATTILRGTRSENTRQRAGSIGKNTQCFWSTDDCRRWRCSPQEIEQAEALECHSRNFDFIEFREYCHHPKDIPELDKLLEIAQQFEDELKTVIVQYLEKIAGADNDFSAQEQAMLSKVKEGSKPRFGISIPPSSQRDLLTAYLIFSLVSKNVI
ncbi:MAG: TerB family tellurite resistance protein [Haliea sp.]|nr:TerB family tellurite resistance protein [Haliea sp.]